ncbi:PD-(D/E)XK nuclease family protein [Caryophanon latum]|nr:PD-(D/E)XK nuclease family protein [Caryophanon latum]
MFEIKKYPQFSWSLSRHKTLQSCQRKYAYDYYVSHNGWLQYNVSPEAQHAYRLKKLQHLPMFFGHVAHGIIEETIMMILRHNEVPDVTTLIERARRKLNDAYIQSKNEAAWAAKPSRSTMLYDMYYNGNLNREEVAIYQERLHIIFENFLNSYTVQQLRQNREFIDLQQAEEFRTIKLNDITVYLVMDILYKDRRTDQWVIVDWKTGKSTADDRQQLALYAYYVHKTLRVPLEQIEVRNEYLLENRYVNTQLDDIDLDVFMHLYSDSVRLMKSFQADILTNEPVELEDFACTQFINRCEKCNYKQMCRKL